VVAPFFDAVAAELSARIAARVLEALAAGERLVEGDVRALRVVVHLRTAGDYQRIAVHHIDGASAAMPYSPSATTWRWVSAHDAPIAIDVHVGRVERLDGRGAIEISPTAGGSPWDTRQSLLGRDATHVIALPLHGRASELVGMVTVEVSAPPAVGLPLWSRGLTTDLARWVSNAGPSLLEAGDPDVCTEAVDEFLPVVGIGMRAVVDTLRVFASQDETIVLCGPTGAGKSQLARWVHQRSPRSAAAFEVVHLATRPEGLRMGELFGWRRGAFSGATADYGGALVRARRGTLFLDEIDKLSLDDQAGLLRVLEDGAYRALGDGGAEQLANVRFLFGTNADLVECVRAGSFREDLYYRIHVLPVRVPPLAERRDEIGAWARYMLTRRHESSGGAGHCRLSDAAAAMLEARDWPGNLRQLDNVMRRAHALARADSTSERVLELSDAHLRRALSFEAAPRTVPLIDALHAAAQAIVRDAEQRRDAGQTVELDCSEALRGLVLAVAAERHGGLDEAFRLLGRGSLVEHRNHMKAFRKELVKIDQVYEAVTGRPSPYGTLLSASPAQRAGTVASNAAEESELDW